MTFDDPDLVLAHGEAWPALKHSTSSMEPHALLGHRTKRLPHAVAHLIGEFAGPTPACGCAHIPLEILRQVHPTYYPDLRECSREWAHVSYTVRNLTMCIWNRDNPMDGRLICLDREWMEHGPSRDGLNSQ